MKRCRKIGLSPKAVLGLAGSFGLALLACSPQNSKTNSDDAAQVAAVKPATVDNLDAEAKNVTDRWVNCKTGDDVAKIVTELTSLDDASLKSKSPAYRYLVSITLPLAQLRGMDYRQTELISKSTTVHVQSLQLLRNFAVRFGIFFLISPSKRLCFFTSPSLLLLKAIRWSISSNRKTI